METKESKLEIWWDEEGGIIKERLIGDLTIDDAKESEKKVIKLSASLRKKGIKAVNLLVDVTKAGTPSTKARDFFSQSLKKSSVDKIAVFGGGIIQKTVANFIFNYSGMKNARYFDNREEALSWLKRK
ncbi:STAS/SEC14 domain-containing protein [Patescibacteria group bacterium]